MKIKTDNYEIYKDDCLDKYGYNLTCRSCKFKPNRRKNDVTKFESCKMICHDKVRFYRKVFAGYEGAINTNPICKHFEPHSFCVYLSKIWSGIDDYIKNLEEYEYKTQPYVKYNKIKDIECVTLVTGEGELGEYHYHVSLYDWLTGNVFDENGNINYMYKFKIETNHRYPRRILVDDRKKEYFKEIGVL